MIDPVTIVDKQIAAYERGDAAAFADTYEENARCIRLPSGEVIAGSRAEIADRWGALFARGRLDVEIVSRIVEGRIVVDHEKVIARDSGTVLSAIAIYEVGPERIRTVWFPESSAAA